VECQVSWGTSHNTYYVYYAKRVAIKRVLLFLILAELLRMVL
jgi:hypothetical protein